MLLLLLTGCPTTLAALTLIILFSEILKFWKIFFNDFFFVKENIEILFFPKWKFQNKLFFWQTGISWKFPVIWRCLKSRKECLKHTKKKKKKKKRAYYGFEELKCRLEFKVAHSFVFLKCFSLFFFKPCCSNFVRMENKLWIWIEDILESTPTFPIFVQF